MIKRTHSIMRLAVAAALVAPFASGCLALKEPDKAPIAVVNVPNVMTAKGAPLTVKSGDTILTGVVPFSGSPVNVTLDGSQSHDPDGAIRTYTWRRTDIPAASRFAPNGMPPADSGLPVFTGDPPATASVTVMLSPGNYRYSLWVEDSRGEYSAPATVALQVVAPDAGMP